MGQTTQNTLPDTYYLDYFNFLLGFIQNNYTNIINSEEERFIKTFQNLTLDGQCIFVRLANRKGSYFRKSKLFYREIENIGLSLDDLHRNRFISYDNKNHIENILFLFTKSELIHIGKAKGWNNFYKNSYKKEDIIFSIIEHIEHSDVYDSLFDEDTIIFFESDDLVSFFKLLFFGDQYSDMTQFVIRDIGNIKLENYDEVDFTPNFSSREEVNKYLEIANAYQIFKELKELVSPLKCYQWFVDEDILLSPPYHTKHGKIYCKLIIKLGKLLEQNSFLIESLQIYSRINISPARERQVRLLTRLNEIEKAKSLAEEMVNQPDNPSEALFAKDFLNAGDKRIKRSTTASLKSANEISVVRDQSRSVERLAVDYFEQNGYEAFHTENSLWRFLFGLVFWEETYDTDQNTFHHPLQRLPSDIHDLSFYENRKEAIEIKLSSLRSRKVVYSKLEKTYQEKYGIANQFVYWSDEMLMLSLKAVELMPLKGLKEVLRMIAIQVKSNSTGFPDLFIFKNKSYHFYEIKSPNDHLSAQQLFWIDFMTKWNIKADVLKVSWEK